MKSVALTPYCPWPANNGAKVEMQKHLEILRSLGECTIASAATRPVGMGWTPELHEKIEEIGYKVTLREDVCRSRTWQQWIGLAYASICKFLKLERAFGHSNPYHRYAFNSDWWGKITCKADVALINYSYWAWLPTPCPKVIILHDLFSNLMWGGNKKETEDLQSADLIIVISKEEEQELYRCGIKNVLWSPPLVKPASFPLTDSVGIVGSANLHNREGLHWLSSSSPPDSIALNVYGPLSEFAKWPKVHRIHSYSESYQPYQECGILLLPTAMGTGVQIKAVEALASGRAIIARRGAMRGLPDCDGAWIEVDSPNEIWHQAERLCRDRERRLEQGERAHKYYKRYLDYNKGLSNLRESYLSLITKHSI